MNERTDFLHNVEAERDVMGACITSPMIWEALGERVTADLFTDASCRQVYSIIMQMQKEGKQPELTEVGMRFSGKGGDIGLFFIEGVPSYEMTKQRLDYLVELRKKRELYELSCRGIKVATDPSASVDECAELISRFSAVTDDEQKEVRFDMAVKMLGNDIAGRMEGKVRKGIMTGLHVFDVRYGFQRGDFIVLGGGTSMGKTTLAVQLTKNIAQRGVPACYYSFEMSMMQLAARILASDVGVSASELLHGEFKQPDFDKFYDRSARMKDLPIYFDERSRTSFHNICLSIRKMVKVHGVRLFVIDYLQILVNGAAENREQVTADMARDLKRLAVELDCCIIALSQVSRSKNGGAPSVNSLRGSGQIEEAADMVVFISRKKSEPERAKLEIAKGRNVGVGSDTVRFDARLSVIADFQAGDPGAQYKEQDEQLPF